VLKAAHHGSARGTQWEILERIAPKYVIVSSDQNGRFKLPDRIGCETFRRYAERRVVALTRETGTIKIVIENGKYKVFRYGERHTDFVSAGTVRELKRDNNPTDWDALMRSARTTDAGRNF